MFMPTSIRLDDEPERLVTDAARVLRLSRSEVIRRSVREYCKQVLEETEVYPSGKGERDEEPSIRRRSSLFKTNSVSFFVLELAAASLRRARSAMSI
jgi:predicted transcriptional regulator